MINISCNTESSIIKFIEVEGHATDVENKKIICAGVSCLTRTVCEIITRLKGVTSSCEVSKPGNVMLKLHDVDEGVQERIAGITDFLIFGLIGIKRDYPDSLKLKINNKEWYNGTQKRWW